MSIPRIGDLWGAGYRVRPGTSKETATVARWRAMPEAGLIGWALDDAVDALERGSDTTSVYVIAAPFPVGLLTICTSVPYLQLVYVDEAHRRTDLGTRATSIVIDQFFADRHGEPWLGVTRPISAAGIRLLRRLGFWELDSGMQLTRASWLAARGAIARQFG